MPVITRVEGALMERLVVARRHGSAHLPPRAAVQYHAALSRLPWAETHLQVMGAFDDHGTLLASAERHGLTGVLDGTPVRLCLIGALATYGADDHHPGRLLLERMLDDATREGLDLAVIAAGHEAPVPGSAHKVPATDVTLRVIESPRRGAPMVPVRSGERADVVAMATMPPLGGDACRLHVDRTADYLDFCVSRARLHAGLDRDGARQLHFQVVEEGGRAAAYVVVTVVGSRWIVEACGDFDASGARVGAILQTLIAASPSERRPEVVGWWPSAVMPPQLEAVSAEPSADCLWVRSLAGASPAPALTTGDLMLWRWDLP